MEKTYLDKEKVERNKAKYCKSGMWEDTSDGGVVVIGLACGAGSIPGKFTWFACACCWDCMFFSNLYISIVMLRIFTS